MNLRFLIVRVFTFINISYKLKFLAILKSIQETILFDLLTKFGNTKIKGGHLMAQSYKTSINFGLVYIPVALHAVVKPNDIGFNMLDKKTKSRVQYKKTCVDCNNREVKQADIVKGYQYEKDKYVIFEDEDFEKIKTNKDRTISIEGFIDLPEIDPIYYDKSYYVVPEKAVKAFVLLKMAMEKENKVGIAKSFLGSKETLLALRVRNGEMILNTMFFEEEIKVNPAKNIDEALSPKELSMAKEIINSMSSQFAPESYRDEYRLRLVEAIEKKVKGQEIVAVDKYRDSNRAIDLMDALEKTLQNATLKKKPTKKNEKR